MPQGELLGSEPLKQCRRLGNSSRWPARGVQPTLSGMFVIPRVVGVIALLGITTQKTGPWDNVSTGTFRVITSVFQHWRSECACWTAQVNTTQSEVHTQAPWARAPGPEIEHRSWEWCTNPFSISIDKFPRPNNFIKPRNDVQDDWHGRDHTCL